MTPRVAMSAERVPAPGMRALFEFADLSLALFNSSALKVASYPVEVDGDQVFIAIDSEESAP